MQHEQTTRSLSPSQQAEQPIIEKEWVADSPRLGVPLFLKATSRETLLHLHHTHGNKYVQRILAAVRRQSQTGAATQTTIQQALTQMRRPTSPLIERNTAQIIDQGRVMIVYLEDCIEDASSPRNTVRERVLRIPNTQVEVLVPRRATLDGFNQHPYIGISRSLSVDEVKTKLIHEVNHELRSPAQPARSNEIETLIEEYKNEFQAHWVAEYRHVQNLDQRADQVKLYILQRYQNIREGYHNDERIRQRIDEHRRPDGNVLNSTRWEAIEQALVRHDVVSVHTQLTAMSSEERAAVFAEHTFMASLWRNLSGISLLKALFLVENFSSYALECVDIIGTSPVDVQGIYQNLQRASDAERTRLRGHRYFLEQLGRVLRPNEYAYANDLLNGIRSSAPNVVFDRPAGV